MRGLGAAVPESCFVCGVVEGRGGRWKWWRAGSSTPSSSSSRQRAAAAAAAAAEAPGKVTQDNKQTFGLEKVRFLESVMGTAQ